MIDAVMPVLDRHGVTLGEFVRWNELAATVGRDHLAEHFTPEQLQVMFEVRMAHPHPDTGTVMQKVLDANSLAPILKQIGEPGSEYQGGGRYKANDIGGCMSAKADAVGLKTPPEILRGLRLDYGPTSPFNEFTRSDHVYVVEGHLADGSEVRVPNGRIAEQLGIDHPMVRDLRTGDPPHTGTGYTGADKGLNPEYEVRKGKWEPGATVYRIDADGSRHPVARLADGDTWVSVKDPADRVVDGWPKHEGTERVFRTPEEMQHDAGTGAHRQTDGENGVRSNEPPPVPVEGPAAVRAFGDVASETNAGASFFDPADSAMHTTADAVPRVPGEYVVDVHGNRDCVILRDGAGNEYRLSAREFAEVIRTRTDWDGHSPIRLMSCDTGAGPFARELSRELGVEVTAPDRPVWAYADGREPVVSSFDRGPGPKYELRPRVPPDGSWIRFTPDGRVEPVLPRGNTGDAASVPRSHPEDIGADDSAVHPHGREGMDSDVPALLGLPDYSPHSLSNAETRTVYAHGELRMQGLDKRWAAEGMSVEERAHRMFETRNELRQWARTLMADREAAAHLNANEKMMTWDRLVEKTEAKGFSGDEVFQEIIDSSTRSRPGVNADLGIDPHNPPPLPPHHGPDAEARAHPSPRGGDDAASARGPHPDDVSGGDSAVHPRGLEGADLPTRLPEDPVLRDQVLNEALQMRKDRLAHAEEAVRSLEQKVEGAKADKEALTTERKQKESELAKRHSDALEHEVSDLKRREAEAEAELKRVQAAIKDPLKDAINRVHQGRELVRAAGELEHLQEQRRVEATREPTDGTQLEALRQQLDEARPVSEDRVAEVHRLMRDAERFEAERLSAENAGDHELARDRAAARDAAKDSLEEATRSLNKADIETVKASILERKASWEHLPQRVRDERLAEQITEAERRMSDRYREFVAGERAWDRVDRARTEGRPETLEQLRSTQEVAEAARRRDFEIENRSRYEDLARQDLESRLRANPGDPWLRRALMSLAERIEQRWRIFDLEHARQSISDRRGAEAVEWQFWRQALGLSRCTADEVVEALTQRRALGLEPSRQDNAHVRVSFMDIRRDELSAVAKRLEDAGRITDTEQFIAEQISYEMSQLAALHEQDYFMAGVDFIGRLLGYPVLGDSAINSSLGSVWKTKVDFNGSRLPLWKAVLEAAKAQSAAERGGEPLDVWFTNLR
ncbi:polymorphic toxin type 15 domain-containing protein [Mycolicibacterium insubricum]|uniref:polymorphic toxin type 15 domain-containing protein n=1 Tax=Mycolicibacterium insubricum TaxID=444597 RepID=UPI0021F3B751|nr:polymorphic toxin type 15 domain-containing protein [Mycolicibacterium insubricum]